MKKRITGVIFLILLRGTVPAQNRAIDSLSAVLRTSVNDSNRIKQLNQLSWEFKNLGQYDSALHLSTEAMNLARQLHLKKGIADSYVSIGVVQRSKGDLSEALDNYFHALELYEELKDPKRVGMTYNNIGNIYYNQGDFVKALQNHREALKARQLIGDRNDIASSYNNIGLIHAQFGEYDQALENYSHALKLNIGLKNDKWTASNYNNIGLVYFAQKNYDKALENYMASLLIKEKLNDQNGIAYSCINLGDLYLQTGKAKKADSVLLRALKISREIGAKEAAMKACLSLSNVREKLHDDHSALEYFRMYSGIKDSIFNETSSKQIAEMSAKYETEKKERVAVEALAENKRQQLFIWVIGIGFLLAGFFALMILRSLRMTRVQKRIIEEQKIIVEKKQKEVVDSIHYAQRIQQSILPTEKHIQKQLNRLKNTK